MARAAEWFDDTNERRRYATMTHTQPATIAALDARRFGYGASGGAAELISAAQAALETYETLAEAQIVLYALMRDGDTRAIAASEALLTASSAAYDLWQVIEQAAAPVVQAAARECLGYELPGAPDASEGQAEAEAAAPPRRMALGFDNTL